MHDTAPPQPSMNQYQVTMVLGEAEKAQEQEAQLHGQSQAVQTTGQVFQQYHIFQTNYMPDNSIHSSSLDQGSFVMPSFSDLFKFIVDGPTSTYLPMFF